MVTIPTAGIWTFGAHASGTTSGTRLRIDGEEMLLAEGGQFPGDVLESRFFSAGDHYLDLVYFAGSADASIELFAAEGNFTSLAQSNAWQLVGNSDSGGLATRTPRPSAASASWNATQPIGSLVYQLATPGAVLASIDTMSDLDYYSIDLVSGEQLLLSATTFDQTDALSATPLDPFILLYNPLGEVVAVDDNSAIDNNGVADGRNAKIDHTAAYSGQYVVAVGSSAGVGNTIFTFDVLQGDTNQDGSGGINVIDVLQLRRALNLTLPAASPTSSAEPQASAAIVDPVDVDANSAIKQTANLTISSRRRATHLKRQAVDQVFQQSIAPDAEQFNSRIRLRSRRSSTPHQRTYVEPTL